MILKSSLVLMFIYTRCTISLKATICRSYDELSVGEVSKCASQTILYAKNNDKSCSPDSISTKMLNHSAMSIHSCLKVNRKNCNDVIEQGFNSNGVYDITVDGKMVSVYCDMTTDDGGWTTIQRRIDGSQDFSLSWQDCVEGFGDLSGEFWLGLKHIHSLTTSGSYQLRVDLEDWEGNQAYALYSRFSVRDSTSNYRLQVSGYSGTAGDAMSFYNNQPFSTRDRDNDANVNTNCAEFHKGGWWYGHCPNSNLNGVYPRRGQVSHTEVGWYYWNDNWYPMKRAEMKIRRS